jgi:hypothetical protein
MTRFAYTPLETHLSRHYGDHDNPVYGCRRVAHLLGVSPNTVTRWRHEGIPLDRADKIAVRLGEHPSTIWPEWWHYDPDHETDVA